MTNSSGRVETLGFQTEVKQLLQLVTHSLYSNREVFLRELISNSSDAADKLRYEAMSDPKLYENDSELKIWVDFDQNEKTISVRDNGIGMSREEVIANLGTIAKSGTREFLLALNDSQVKNTNLIGQFGVGFYSSFVVANKVIVKTRKAGLEVSAGVLWESDGNGEFKVSTIEKDSRGTEIVLYLKPEDTDLLDQWKLQQIITKYSDHIMLPILMKKELEETEPAKSSEEKTITEEVVNKATALWTLPKSEIKDEDYKALYRHLNHGFEDPLAWSHNRVEGKLEYITLIYLPAHAPFDLWSRERKYGLKLYVQRVFIMDEAEQLLPSYLRFVRGVVDSKDLPLNVSREILQNNRIIEQIRSSIVKRALDLIENLAVSEPDKFDKFWEAFGGVLKEGMVEDHANQGRIAKLLRFYTTKDNNTVKPEASLDNYLSRMSQDQDKIYYITAENLEVAKSSPYLETFHKNDIEVLLLVDRIDEWWLSHYSEHQGKKFQSITRGDVDLSKLQKESLKQTDNNQQSDYTKLLESLKSKLADKVTEVRLSKRLTDSPVCVVTTEDDLSFNMQRIMSSFGQQLPKTKPILELNPDHQLVKSLLKIDDEAVLKDWAEFLYDEAALIAGNKLDDAVAFTSRVNRLLAKVMM